MSAWITSEYLESAQFKAERRVLVRSTSGHCAFPSLKKSHKQNCDEASESVSFSGGNGIFCDENKAPLSED